MHFKILEENNSIRDLQLLNKDVLLIYKLRKNNDKSCIFKFFTRCQIIANLTYCKLRLRVQHSIVVPNFRKERQSHVLDVLFYD